MACRRWNQQWHQVDAWSKLRTDIMFTIKTTWQLSEKMSVNKQESKQSPALSRWVKNTLNSFNQFYSRLKTKLTPWTCRNHVIQNFDDFCCTQWQNKLHSDSSERICSINCPQCYCTELNIFYRQRRWKIQLYLLAMDYANNLFGCWTMVPNMYGKRSPESQIYRVWQTSCGRPLRFYINCYLYNTHTHTVQTFAFRN